MLGTSFSSPRGSGSQPASLSHLRSDASVHDASHSGEIARRKRSGIFTDPGRSPAALRRKTELAVDKWNEFAEQLEPPVVVKSIQCAFGRRTGMEVAWEGGSR